MKWFKKHKIISMKNMKRRISIKKFDVEKFSDSITTLKIISIIILFYTVIILPSLIIAIDLIT